MPQRKSPAAKDRAISTTPIASRQPTRHRRQDGFAAPTLEDRAEQRALDLLRERGYRLAVRCTCCGHWAVSEGALATHMGPVCRARLGG